MKKRPFAISNILVTTSTRFTVSLCNTIHDALTLLSFNPPIAFHSIHQEFFAWKHLPHFILFYCVQWTMPNNWFMFYSHSLWNWLFCACTKSPRNICTHTQAIACADMDDYNKHSKAQKKNPSNGVIWFAYFIIETQRYQSGGLFCFSIVVVWFDSVNREAIITTWFVSSKLERL